uniref:Protein kinase domain-containing protein n=1 Tax=Moniliophthora roreri TaxID=221103 RepID=A0A0W0GAC5_MONRR
MEDAGCPLQDVRNLRTVVTCIGKASTGLSIMFSAGMVHRDISTGNLLVSEVDGELGCKITDLEYAKKVGASSQSPQDIKTGTPYFMALEIWRGKYLFRPERPTDSDETSDDENFVSTLKRRGARPDARTPVRYNFLHDLESLFWILVYFLLIMHPVNGKVGADGEVNAGNNVNELVISHRMHTFHELFPSFSNFDVSNRLDFLKGDEDAKLRYKSSVPKQFVVAMQFAIAVSKQLRVEYQRVEALPELTADKFSAKPYKRLRSYATKLAGSEEEGVWLGDMFDMSEHVVPNVERTIQEDGGVSKKRAAEQVTGGLSMEEGKRSKQSEK